MFGYIKRKLCDLEIKGKSKEKPVKLSKAVMNVMFNLSKYQMEGFFKKTFLNMINFWHKLKRKKLLRKIEEMNFN